MSMYGEWGRFERHIRTLPERLDKALERTTAKLAHQLTKDWVDGIRHQTLGLVPNAPATIKAKRGSSTPLIDHGDLIGSIKPHPINQGNWFVGIRKNELDEDGVSLSNVADKLEYGTKTIPPRPAKRITYDRFKPKMKKAYSKTIKREVYHHV